MGEIWDFGQNPHGARGVYYDSPSAGRVSVHRALAQFLPFARCSFDGTLASPTPSRGYNVASVTKNATGDYTVTFTAAGEVAAKQAFVTVNGAGFGTKFSETASTVRIRTYDGSNNIDAMGTLKDFSSVDIAVFD